MDKINVLQSRKKRHENRFIWIVLGFIFSSLATILIINAFRDSIMFFYSPQDIQTKTIATNQTFRLGGLVKQHSLIKNGQSIQFIITDTAFDVKVKYNGTLPNLFRQGQGVVAQGHLNKHGVMIANTILAKHDEKYMPKDVIDILKKQDTWQGKNND